MSDPSSKEPGTLTTPELLAAIEEEFGLRLSREAIRSWVKRPDNPLPVAYKGKPGQAHLFRWLEFLEWFDRETESQQAATDKLATAADRPELEAHIDTLDWHSAKTVSAREQAKRDILETAKAEGTYGDLATMAHVAEDTARQAVQQLMAIPARIAPQLAAIDDETEVDRLLDAELRNVCQQIAAAASRSADADDDAPASEQTQ
jgi:phage terminase Nu1 subunit (DNA packaging protein)